jgi:hypothetical protein
MLAIKRMHLRFVLAACLCFAGVAHGQSRNLAPGFDALPKNAKVVLMPTDIELFEISAGGILEPKAEWTQSAVKFFRTALTEKKKSLGASVVELSEQDVDSVAEVNSLHAALANAITAHHFGLKILHLPTKDGKLDWSMGDSVRALKEKSSADYALFTWIRDSYASGGRVAAVVVMAALGVGMAPGGRQVGYASLVDLNTGQIMWFNRLVRTTGDLREADKAVETLGALLTEFPAPK